MPAGSCAPATPLLSISLTAASLTCSTASACRAILLLRPRRHCVMPKYTLQKFGHAFGSLFDSLLPMTVLNGAVAQASACKVATRLEPCLKAGGRHDQRPILSCGNWERVDFRRNMTALVRCNK